MELENKVPDDISRRKIIARLLNIPPMLFGLAVLEDMTLEPPQAAPMVATGQTKLVRVAFEPAKYQNTVYTLWQLHEASNAHSAFPQLIADIHDLEHFEQQSQGDLRYHIQELLLSDQILATHIVRDQRQFRRAHAHANEAVRVAKSMGDADLMATALFTRGWTYLEWGLFGTIERGIFQAQQDKISAAIRNFQAARDLFPSQDGAECMHPQLLGSLTMFLSRARGVLALSRGEDVPTSIFVSMEDVANTVDKQEIDDPYTRVLVKGERISWHQGNYLDHRATTFSVLGLPGKALRELKELERLTENTYNRDETRRFTYLDILRSNIYMGMKEYDAATRLARQALLACQDIRSITNIAIITDIYGRLLKGRYKSSRDVEELGDMLRESSVNFLEPEE